MSVAAHLYKKIISEKALSRQMTLKVTQRYRNCYGCKCFAAKNREIYGPLAAKNAKFADNLQSQL